MTGTRLKKTVACVLKIKRNHATLLLRFCKVSGRQTASEILLSKKDGMIKDCAINFDHIQTVSKGKIGSLITTLSPEKLGYVHKAVQFSLNL